MNMKLLNVHYLFIIVFCLGLGYLRYIRHQAPTGEIREKNMRSSFFSLISLMIWVLGKHLVCSHFHIQCLYWHWPKLVWVCRFGSKILDVHVGWIKNLCSSKDFPSYSVLDIRTGSGGLLQQLAKQGYAKEMWSVFFVVSTTTVCC